MLSLASSLRGIERIEAVEKWKLYLDLGTENSGRFNLMGSRFVI